MKKIVTLFLTTLMACFVLSACGDETNSTQIEPYVYDEANTQATYDFENDNLELHFDSATTQISVKNKATGYVWYSNPQDAASDKFSKGKQKNLLYSTLNIIYSDSTDTQVELENYSQCIKNKNYQVEALDNGVAVHFSLGDVSKVYYLPNALPESKMNEYLGQMDERQQKTVKRMYKYIKYDELSGDELSTYEARYPDLSSESVYEITKLSDSYKNELERIFTAIGYTPEQYEEDNAIYNFSYESDKPIFNVTVYYQLDKDGLVVSIPMKEIQYKTDYPIIQVTALPYMGCGGVNDEGYMIVPEGNGGIINFNNGKTGQQSYIADVYGWDYASTRSSVVDETCARFPMYAIVNNGNSMISTIETGSAHAKARADVSGRTNGYNSANFAYRLLRGETMDITSKSSTTVRIYEQSLPDETIQQRYMFSDKTEYSDLATAYREYLMAKYPEQLKKLETTSVPTTIEYIGAVDNTEQVIGIPVNRPLALTTYEQAEEMTKNFVDAGMKDLNIKYTGWFNKGVKQESAAEVNLIGRLGSKSDLKTLASFATDNNINLFMSSAFTFVYKNNRFDGFGVNRDAAKFASREEAELFEYSPVTFIQDDDKDTYYLTKPSYTLKNIDKFKDNISDYGIKNISFLDVGSILSADYNPKNRVSREASLAGQVNKLKELNEAGNKVMIQNGNLYAVPYADFVTNMPIETKASNIIDQNIPFYTMALHGLVNFSGDAINLASDFEENKLRTIETGSGLFFTLTKQPSSVLQDTEFTQYYATDYDKWKDSAVDVYTEFNSKFADLSNQFIVKHEKLGNGVFATTYESGKKVIVNYNYNDYNYMGTNIPARGYILQGGGE